MYKKPLVIIPREEWSDPPKPVPPLDLLDLETLIHPVQAVILSYTGTPTCLTNDECKAAMRELHDKYKAQGLYEMPYNFVVGGDGTVYEARGWTRIPAVNKEHPTLFDRSVEIAHFGEVGKIPDTTQIQGSWLLTLYGMHHNYIDPDPQRYQQFLEPVPRPVENDSSEPVHQFMDSESDFVHQDTENDSS